MSSWFDFLDDIFGGRGGGYPSTQGDAPLDKGFPTFQAWAIGQAFAGAGPLGQYMGLLYTSPRDPIPNIDWPTLQQQRFERSRGYVDYGSFIDFLYRPDGDAYGSFINLNFAYRPDSDVSYDDVSQADAFVPGDSTSAQPENDPPPAPSQTAESRTLEVFDGGESGSSPPQPPMPEVNVFGSPPDRPSRPPDPNTYLLPQQYDSGPSGPELRFRWGDPQPPPPIPRRRVHKPTPAPPMTPTPQQPQPESDLVDMTPSTVPNPPLWTGNPWMSDAPVPEQSLPWGAWDRPENVPSPRLERGDSGTIETVPTVPVERSFWSRGGTGLATGVATAAGGVAMLLWWNPVGWLAGATALMIAGGVAATTASAVELGASYGGVTSAEQDVQMNRAVSAALEYGSGSVGGILGGVVGTVAADDPELGFEEGAVWGGLVEGAVGLATSLPGALRAVPGLWRAAQPWAKSLLRTPLWFFMTAGPGGRGSVRSMERVFAAQGRIASRIRTVEYLGTTPLLERDANWARFQVFATRSRNEAIFRITDANGQQRIVLADRFMPGSLTNLEAKLGDMGHDV